jgi:hypothetical protein
MTGESLPCSQLHRLETAEDNIKNVKQDLRDIKDTLTSIDNEVRKDLTNLSSQFTEFTVMMQGVAIRAEERDKRTTEIFVENKTTFERFGNKIDKLENRLNAHGLLDVEHTNKIATLEKIMYGGFTAMGSVIVWLLQEIINR